ncbi:MAG: efflux RND transporter periplasmic adaptor subunit [Spirochaetales bacterium]|nr:efflux RND transporter periplasmic adaptor subunit [Spirochaetales bacterium]
MIKKLNTILILTVLAAAVSCSLETGEIAVAGADQTNRRNVRIHTVEEQDLENRIVLSGEVSSAVEVNVVPETSGLLSRIIVSPGDFVEFDDIVAYVDPSRPGMHYTESPVRSKAAGTVTYVPATAGNQVTPQSVIVEIGDLEELEITVAVPERYLGLIHSGIRGRVTSRAFPEDPEKAHVSDISPVVDPRTRSVEVTLVPDAHSRLRSGQAVQVELILETREQVLAVPNSAVTERQDGTGLFVVEDGQARWRLVETGIIFEGMTEIHSGVGRGEEIVTAGLELLTDGSAVRKLQG